VPPPAAAVSAMVWSAACCILLGGGASEGAASTPWTSAARRSSRVPSTSSPRFTRRFTALRAPGPSRLISVGRSRVPPASLRAASTPRMRAPPVITTWSGSTARDRLVIRAPGPPLSSWAASTRPRRPSRWSAFLTSASSSSSVRARVRPARVRPGRDTTSRSTIRSAPAGTSSWASALSPSSVGRWTVRVRAWMREGRAVAIVSPSPAR
jgi:hypothetical protein